jgi:hypothetical protein
MKNKMKSRSSRNVLQGMEILELGSSSNKGSSGKSEGGRKEGSSEDDSNVESK